MNWRCRIGLHDYEDDKEGGWGRLGRQLEENKKLGGHPVSSAIVEWRCKRKGCNAKITSMVH